MRPGHRTALALFAGLFAVYLLLAAVLPVADDEVYYWSWTRPLQFSYYDHPPLTAYLIRLSTWVLGDSILGIRVPACLAMLFVVIVIARLSRPNSLLAGVLLSPLFTLGAVLMTPDAPLLCAWAAYVWWLVEVHSRLTPVAGDGGENAPGSIPWWLWLLGGGILGCGVLGKYTMALAVPSGFVSFLMVRHLWRRWLPGYIFHGVVSFLVASPILIHNIQHDFVPLLFQWRHSMGDSRPGLRAFGDFVGVQLLLFGTLPFVLYPWVLWNFNRLCQNPRLRACACLYALPMTFFLYKATRSPLQGNWGLVMFISFWPLAAVWFESVRQSRFWRWSTAASFIIPAACVVALTIHVIKPLPIIPAEGDRVTTQYVLSDTLHQIAAAVQKRGDPLPVFTPTYQMTAWLRFLSLDGRQIDQISRPSHFTQRPEHLTDVSRAYVVADFPLPVDFAKGFAEPELIGSFPVVVRGKQIRDIKLYLYTKTVAARHKSSSVVLVNHEDLSSEPLPLNREQLEPQLGHSAELLVRLRIFDVTNEGFERLGLDSSRGFQRLAASDYDERLQQLIQLKLVTIQAEPVLLVRPNETASFFRGDAFPFPVPSSDGQITVEWRDVGTTCNVTAKPADDGQAFISFELEVSEQDAANAITLNGMTVPGISRRRVRSTLAANLQEPSMLVLCGASKDEKQLMIRYEVEEFVPSEGRRTINDSADNAAPAK